MSTLARVDTLQADACVRRYSLSSAQLGVLLGLLDAQARDAMVNELSWPSARIVQARTAAVLARHQLVRQHGEPDQRNGVVVSLTPLGEQAARDLDTVRKRR